MNKSMQVNKRWSKEEIEFIVKNNDKGYHYLYDNLYRTEISIRMKLNELGYKKRNNVVRKHTYNKMFFDNWTKEMAYTLGLILADGCIDESRNKLSIILNVDDKSILEKIKEHMECSNTKLYTPTKHLRGNRKECRQLQLVDGSGYLINRLNQLGIVSNKTYTATYMNVPVEYQSSFVRGFFDGDGSIYWNTNRSKPELSFVGTHDVMNMISNFITNGTGIKRRSLCIYKKSNERLSKIYYTRTDDVKKIMKWLYDNNNNLYIERKYNKYTNLLHRFAMSIPFQATGV